MSAKKSWEAWGWETSIPTSTTMTSLLYRDTMSFMLARHWASRVVQVVGSGYRDMPQTSHRAPLDFNPSKIQRNKALS